MPGTSPLSVVLSALLVATTLASPCVLAAEAPPAAAAADATKPMPKIPPGALGPQQQQLEGLAGHWSVRQSFWTDPSRPPAIDQGEATFTPVLDGRHLRQDLRIDSAAKLFKALGYLGYDPAAGTYGSLWMDVNFSGVIIAHGGYDAGAHTFTFTGKAPNATGAKSPVREVLRIQDADHFTYEFYERHDGREGLAVRLEYTRTE